MVSGTKVISICELCVYIPIFFLTLIIIFRHGFNRQLGWIYLVIFCLVRSAGAGFKLASENDPTNATDIEWAAILSSVGLSPLLMASMGLLKRVYVPQFKQSLDLPLTLLPTIDAMMYQTTFAQTRTNLPARYQESLEA